MHSRSCVLGWYSLWSSLPQLFRIISLLNHYTSHLLPEFPSIGNDHNLVLQTQRQYEQREVKLIWTHFQ